MNVRAPSKGRPPAGRQSDSDRTPQARLCRRESRSRFRVKLWGRPEVRSPWARVRRGSPAARGTGGCSRDGPQHDGPADHLSCQTDLIEAGNVVLGVKLEGD